MEVFNHCQLNKGLLFNNDKFLNLTLPAYKYLCIILLYLQVFLMNIKQITAPMKIAQNM